MSTYLPESELSRFNAADAGTWTPVSNDTLTVIEQSQPPASDSPTALSIRPSVRSSTSGDSVRAAVRSSVPSVEKITAAADTVGLAKVESRHDDPALRKQAPGVRLDLSGVAKGYAVDLVADYLSEKGMADYLVEVGGELRASGTGPAGGPWRVGIENPSLAANDVQHVVDLGKEALATSGNYRIFFERDGRRYSHVIDPQTGRPVDHDLASVTVLAPTTHEADALSTAMLVLGRDKGMVLAREHDIAAYFISGSEGAFEESASPAFNRRESA